MYHMKTSLWDKIAAFLSACCVFAAATLLFMLCLRCYPEIGAYGKAAFFGDDDSPARAAFSVLAESLEDGETIRDSLVKSYEVLIGTEN